MKRAKTSLRELFGDIKPEERAETRLSFQISNRLDFLRQKKGLSISRLIELGNGQILEGLDICGLRFSKIQPSKWKEEYNLSDYLYFEAIPVKEMSF